MNEDTEKLQYAQWIFERNLGWIAAAEVKAGVAVTIDIAMMGSLAVAFSSLKAAERTAWETLLTIFAISFLIISLGCISMSLLPRLNGPSKSQIFFGCITNSCVADYVEKFKATTTEVQLEDLLTQIHRNAEIARDKFRWVRKGMCWAFASVLPWIAALSLLTNR